MVQDSLQRCNFIEGFDLRTLTSMRLQACGIFTNDGDRLELFCSQWQESSFVFQQDDSFFGNMAGGILMCLCIERTSFAAGVKDVRGEHYAQVAPDFFIETGHRKLTTV